MSSNSYLHFSMISPLLIRITNIINYIIIDRHSTLSSISFLRLCLKCLNRVKYGFCIDFNVQLKLVYYNVEYKTYFTVYIYVCV